MSGVIVRGYSKRVPSMKYMNSLALKVIFDRPGMILDEHRLLEDGLAGWQNKADLSIWEKSELACIISCLKKDKEGGFDKEKFAWKKANIDYRTVYPDGI